MATIKRNFYYYDIEQSDPPCASRLQTVLDLDTRVRSEFTQNGQQMLFNAELRDNLWCGFATLLREDARPELGRRGSTDGVPINMGNSDGILERSHFVFSPRHSVLLFEYNQYGPRATSFFRGMDHLYIKHCDQTADEMTWSYVPRSDSLARLRRGTAVTSVKFSTKPTTFSQIDETDASVSGLISDARSFGPAKKVGIHLQADKKTPLMSVSDWLERFLTRRSVSDYETLEVKVIKPNGYLDTIDLVKEHVHTSISFLGMDDSRRISTEQAISRMRQEIQNQYGDL